MAWSEMAVDLVADRAEVAGGPVVAAVASVVVDGGAEQAGDVVDLGAVRRRRRCRRAGRISVP